MGLCNKRAHARLRILSHAKLESQQAARTTSQSGKIRPELDDADTNFCQQIENECGKLAYTRPSSALSPGLFPFPFLFATRASDVKSGCAFGGLALAVTRCRAHRDPGCCRWTLEKVPQVSWSLEAEGISSTSDTDGFLSCSLAALAAWVQPWSF